MYAVITVSLTKKLQFQGELVFPTELGTRAIPLV